MKHLLNFNLGMAVLSFFVHLAAPVALAGEFPDPVQLLHSMDANLQFDTRTSITTMQVVDSRHTREYRMLTHARGLDEAAVEYLSPEREKGTKMLKLGDNLWLYLPRSERVQKISGHMLRQGMMGSDISYEDLMQGTDFEDMYEATVKAEDLLDGRPCWKLEAIARDDTVSYPRRVLWIDEEWLIPSRQELYALSGMLLKVWTMTEVREIAGRQVPMLMEIEDKLKQGSRTVLRIEDLQFGVDLEDEVFSQRWLERR